MHSESENVSHSFVFNSLQPHGLYVVHQALLSMEFSKQEYWSGYHSLLQGIFLIQGLNLVYCITGIFFTVWATRKAPKREIEVKKKEKKRQNLQALSGWLLEAKAYHHELQNAAAGM